jgi:hypothetical protein
VSLTDAQLSGREKEIIAKSVDTINNWNILCKNGVSISMVNDPDIQYIKEANIQLKNQTSILTAATTNLRAKLAQFNLKC